MRALSIILLAATVVLVALPAEAGHGRAAVGYTGFDRTGPAACEAENVHTQVVLDMVRRAATVSYSGDCGTVLDDATNQAGACINIGAGGIRCFAAGTDFTLLRDGTFTYARTAAETGITMSGRLVPFTVPA